VVLVVVVFGVRVEVWDEVVWLVAVVVVTTVEVEVM
jgi:hypothetical protein